MPNTIISPTVGRVVWYYPPGRMPDQQPQAAIVAHVHGDTCVNLAIWDDNGRPIPYPPTSIRLVQEGDPIPMGGNYCTWMPHQIAQAQKENYENSGRLTM